ncbi:MAG: oligosaccharide flippase family protein [Armatimonadota bacterium]
MLRQLVKDSAIYAVGTIASRLVGFIMIPVYTRVLTPADYGIIETIIRLVDIVGLFLALGLAEALLRHYYLAKGEEDRRRLVGTVFTLNLAVVLVGSLLVLPFSSQLAKIAFGHSRYAHYVAVSLVGMLVGSLIELPLTLWRAEGKAWRFTSVSLMKLTTQLATNIVLVVWLRWSVWGVVLSGLINAVVWSAVLAVVVRRRYGLCWDLRWIKPVLRYGLPLVPAALSQFVLHFSDRFFLTRYVTESELGLYSLAYRFGMLVNVFYGIIVLAWGPWIFRVGVQEQGTKQIARAASLVLVGFACISVCISLLSGPVIHLLSSPSFWGAAFYVPPLTLAYWLFVLQGVSSAGARIANRTDVLGVINVLSAGICLGLSVILIRYYGTWGAIWTTLLSFLVLALGSYAVSQKVFPVHYDWGSIVLSIFIQLTPLAYTGAVMNTGWSDLVVRLGLVAGTFAVAWLYLVRVRRVVAFPETWRRKLRARFSGVLS